MVSFRDGLVVELHSGAMGKAEIINWAMGRSRVKHFLKAEIAGITKKAINLERHLILQRRKGRKKRLT